MAAQQDAELVNALGDFFHHETLPFLLLVIFASKLVEGKDGIITAATKVGHARVHVRMAARGMSIGLRRMGLTGSWTWRTWTFFRFFPEMRIVERAKSTECDMLAEKDFDAQT